MYVFYTVENRKESGNEAEQWKSQAGVGPGGRRDVSRLQNVGIFPDHVSHEGKATDLCCHKNEQEGEYVQIPLIFSGVGLF